MSVDILAGQWKQLRGRIKETWGKLTDDDYNYIDGKRDRLVGRLQERYGYSQMQADAEIDRFLKEHDRTP